MAQHKIDNQIREKLNARELQPSAKAWDRLDAMLSVAETQKPKRNFGWLYIAATLLLFSGLGFVLLNSNETVIIENTMPVVTNEMIQEETQKSKFPTEIYVANSKQPVLVQNKGKNNQNQTAVVVNRIDENREVKDELPTSNFQLPTSSYKYLSPEELLAEIEQPNKDELNKIQINPTSKIQIDANELLTKVEQEVHQKHKESTINKLKRNFNEVKSAVANRNYE